MVDFYNCKDSVAFSEIEKTEKLLNIILPMEYKAHLAKYNGSRCKPDVFYFNENGKRTSSSVEWFLAIYDGKYNNFVEVFKTLKLDQKRIPIDIIPIISDGLGNFVCIDQVDGKIYFWDHEKEVDYTSSNDTDRSNLYFIANNFNQFVGHLTDE